MNMTITDDRELAGEMENRTRAVLALVDLIGGDALDKAGALITAATVLIERSAGGNQIAAADVLAMLTNPTLAAWRGAAH